MRAAALRSCVAAPKQHNHTRKMKKFTLALLAALPMGLSLADETPAAPAPAPAAEATAALPATHAAIVQELLATLDELTAVLKSATDKDSADAAATKIAPIVEKMKATVAAGEALGEPTPEIEAAMEPLKPELEAKFGGLMEALVPLMMSDFHGSTALKEAMESME